MDKQTKKLSWQPPLIELLALDDSDVIATSPSGDYTGEWDFEW